MTIVEFLEARITEDEADAHPQTVIISGGYPAPEVVNCIGASGKPCTWRLDDPMGDNPGWWKSPAVTVKMREHELTHVTPARRRALAECAAKRAIIKSLASTAAAHSAETRIDQKLVLAGMDTGLRLALTSLTAPYSDHPDYRAD